MQQPAPSVPPQRSAVRRLAGSVSLLLLALVVAGGLRLIALPFIVHAVSPDVYGTYVTLWVVLTLMHGVCDLGLGSAAVRLAPECATAGERRSLFGTALATRAAAAMLVTALVMAGHETLARWMTGSRSHAPALLWLLAIAPFAMLVEGLTDELRSRNAMSRVAVLRVLWAALVQGLSVALVVGLALELRGLVWARALAELLVFATAAAFCWRFVRGRPSAARLRALLAFGWPFGFLYVLTTLRVLDRPLIRSMAAIDQVAAYDLATRLAGPIGLVNIALGMVLEPFIYGQSQARDTPRYVDLFLRSYLAVFSTIAMSLALFGHELLTVFAPPAYHGAIAALPALAFATTCEGLQRIAGVGTALAKQTRVWAAASLLGIVLGFSLTIVLLPELGLAGAGLAWLVAAAAAAVLTYAVARRVSGIVLPFGRGLALLLSGAALGTLAAREPWPLAARVALLAGFSFVAWRTLEVQWSTLKALFRAPR